MLSKLIKPLFILMMLASGLWAEAKAGARTLNYKGGTSTFNNLQIVITPNYQAIRFKSWQGKIYSMDCKLKDDSLWRCCSACSKGQIDLRFSLTEGFTQLEIASLDIVPRLCDGSASKLDRPVKVKEPMTFTRASNKKAKKTKATKP